MVRLVLSATQDWRLYIIQEYADGGPLSGLYGNPAIWPAPGHVHLVSHHARGRAAGALNVNVGVAARGLRTRLCTGKRFEAWADARDLRRTCACVRCSRRWWPWLWASHGRSHTCTPSASFMEVSLRL